MVDGEETAKYNQPTHSRRETLNIGCNKKFVWEKFLFPALQSGGFAVISKASRVLKQPAT